MAFTPEAEETIPFHQVMKASIDIYREWEMVEDEGLPPKQRDAYQEGVLRALEILNSRTGITVETMDEEARERLGVDPARESVRSGLRMENPDEVCDECGEDLVHSLGREEPFCIRCDG